MPYIASETVKEIRKEIRETFKGQGLKFSVTTEHHSTVNVDLMEGTFEFEKEYFGINHMWMKEHGHSEEVQVMVTKILEIINKHQEQKELVHDSDYGSVPTFYINIGVGKWNKPYKKVA